METQKPGRVSANSKVNFQRLTDQEMTQRYVNMFNELQSLRGKYLKAQKQKEEEEEKNRIFFNSHQNQNLIKAYKALKQQKFQLEDCSSLLESLVDALSQKKLRCESLEFSLLCALVRKVLKKSKGAVGLTQDLQSFFIESQKTDLLSTIVGAEHSVIDRSDNSIEREYKLPGFSGSMTYSGGFPGGPIYMSSGGSFSGQHPPPMIIAYSNSSLVHEQSLGIQSVPLEAANLLDPKKKKARKT